MALEELSADYEESARLLRRRLRELRRASAKTSDSDERRRLEHRIADLTPMLKQMEDLAELTARYYDPAYYRNEKYSSNCFRKFKKNYYEKEKQ